MIRITENTLIIEIESGTPLLDLQSLHRNLVEVLEDVVMLQQEEKTLRTDNILILAKLIGSLNFTSHQAEQLGDNLHKLPEHVQVLFIEETL